jgi:hypothetical protein
LDRRPANGRHSGRSPGDDRTRRNGNGRNSNGGSSGGVAAAGGGSGAGGGMTASQRRAIEAIADRLGIDPHYDCHELFHCDLDRLTIREASQFIDHLKGLQPSDAHGGH